jgi:AcrR family transcriptional regulator
MKKPTVSKQTLRRESSENKLLDAFEAVISHHGVENVGVNAIIREAGVGKGLLYEYFGSLDGLAEEWVKRRHLLPSMTEVIGEPLDSFTQKPFADQVSALHISYANMLKNNPVALQILAEDILTVGQLPSALNIVRNQIGKTHEQFFTEVTPITNNDDMALVFILQAAANYLALRAHNSPNYNGLMLDTDEGWQHMMDMMARVSELTIHGKTVDTAKKSAKK